VLTLSFRGRTSAHADDLGDTPHREQGAGSRCFSPVNASIPLLGPSPLGGAYVRAILGNDLFMASSFAMRRPRLAVRLPLAVIAPGLALRALFLLQPYCNRAGTG
jgi:hypothetical protein